MDCNKTTNFLAELQRLCGSRDRCTADAANEEQCPMFGICSCGIANFCAKDAKKTVQNGATNTRRKHTHRIFLKNFQMRRAIQTEPRLYAEKQHTAESVRG